MTTGFPAPYVFRGDAGSPVIGAAIHAGHDTRPRVAELLALDEATRLREEDPYTDRITACAGFRVLANRSRFEFDLNRERDEAIYRAAEESWGLPVWRRLPPPDVIVRSLEIYDRFYEALGDHLDRLSRGGPFIVLDIHSYNHRRDGPDAECAPQEGNPDVNVGTGSMPERWRPIADSLIAELGKTAVRGHRLDVRENVRFEGRAFARWIHERYPDTGCALALEFKKTFMDEWTGNVDVHHLDALTDALRTAIPSVVRVMREAA